MIFNIKRQIKANLKNFISPNILMKFVNKKGKNSVLKINKFFIKNTNYNKQVLNKKIELSLYNFKKENIKTNFAPIWFKNESFFHISDSNFSIKKELNLIKLNKKRQLFYFVKEFIYSLTEHNKLLIKQNSLVKDKVIDLKKYYQIDNEKLILFYNKYTSILYFNYINCKNINVKINIINLILKNISKFYAGNIVLNHIFKNNINWDIKNITNLYFAYQILLNNWSKNVFYIDSYSLNNNQNINFNKFYAEKKVKSLLLGRNLLSARIINSNLINKHKNTNKKNLLNYIWKNNNTLFFRNKNVIKRHGQKRFYALSHNHLFTNNKQNVQLIKRNKTRHMISPNLLYILFRLEEKIDTLSKNAKTQSLASELIKIYNLLNILIKEKNDKGVYLGLVLSNINEIFKIKKNDWKIIFLKKLNFWINKELNSNELKSKKIENFWVKLSKKLTILKKRINLKKLNQRKKNVLTNNLFFNINKKRNFFALNFKENKYNSTRLEVKKPLIGEKLRLNNKYINPTNAKNALSVLTNKKVNIFFINALSLTKYAFNLERQLEKKEKRSPTVFLQNIDRDMINKYKYVAVYIKDLIRVCFIGMFLKKPTFIAKFIAFQIAKLPRNRKETSFIRFIVKVVKTFAAEREEILGLRIKFKGRVNRWRRTKSITGERGIIPLHTINNRIEFGNAQAINRKGALGVSIWIRYNPTFSSLIKESILKYFTYSKRLKIKNKIPQTINFTKKH